MREDLKSGEREFLRKVLSRISQSQVLPGEGQVKGLEQLFAEFEIPFISTSEPTELFDHLQEQRFALVSFFAGGKFSTRHSLHLGAMGTQSVRDRGHVPLQTWGDVGRWIESPRNGHHVVFAFGGMRVGSKDFILLMDSATQQIRVFSKSDFAQSEGPKAHRFWLLDLP